MAERSKAVDLSSIIWESVGSNPSSLIHCSYLAAPTNQLTSTALWLIGDYASLL